MRLSVQIEFDKTLDIVTKKTSVIVGRAHGSGLIIPHNSISRTHCKIEFVEKKFYITDLGSSNGTYINGKRLIPERREEVPPGASLSLGGLESELSDFIPNVREEKLVSKTMSESGDFTSTIRIARIDLNQPSLTLELEKKSVQSKMKGPRNPVTAHEEIVVETGSAMKKVVVLLLGVVILGLAWHFGQ